MVIEQLQQWFDIPYLIWTRDVEIVSQGFSDGEESVTIRLYTDNNVYTITAKVGATSYLGCVASARKPRAGEDWARGNDLPDGKFCKETFDAILAGIVGYETVRVHRDSTHEPGKEPYQTSELSGSPKVGCRVLYTSTDTIEVNTAQAAHKWCVTVRA